MNNSLNTSEDIVHLRPVMIVIPEIVAIVCSICGFAGNFLTMLTILVSPSLRKNANNWFVCNLSVADSLFCAFALPIQALIYHNREQPWGDQFCVWEAALKYVIFGASLLTLCVIACNRYVHVIHPDLQSRFFKQYLIVLLIVLCWVLPIFLHIWAVIGVWGGFDYEPSALICTFGRSSSANVRSHQIVGFVSSCLPIFFMGYCYARIAFSVFRSQKRVQQWAWPQDKATKTQGLQLTKTMMTICVLFVLCVVPYSIVGIFDSNISCQECHLLTPMLNWIQISLNPIVYTITNSQFYEAYKKLISILICKITLTRRQDMLATSFTQRRIQETR